jgi:hypothetical protein
MFTTIAKAERRRASLKTKGLSCLAILVLLMSPALIDAAELKPDTLQAWDAYVRAAKMRMQLRANGQAPFLWLEEHRDLAQRVRAGEVLAEPDGGDAPHNVPGGLIHAWVGAVFLPSAKLDEVAGVLGDYERYKDFFSPMVVSSKIDELTPDSEKVSLLMVQKAFSVTGAAETVDEVRSAKLGADRAYSISTSVVVHEIADFGKPSQHALPPDHGPGYIWRTFTVTRLEQGDGGVYAEFEMIALSRGIPFMFRWMVQPLAEHLPRNILIATLQDTRAAVCEAASLRAQAMYPPNDAYHHR